MGLFDDLKALFGDAFLAFPLMMAGFVFLFGILTSNIGLLYLFIGQALLVPSVGFLSNLHAMPHKKPDGTWNFFGLFRLIWSALALFRANTWAENPMAVGIPTALLLASQLGLNGFIPRKAAPSPQCGILPSGDDYENTIFTSPSMWILQLGFLTFFILSNAISIYKLPTPEISTYQDERTKKERMERLEDRVQNRKSTTIMISIMVLIVFLSFVYFRYNQTDCEKGFFASLPAIVLVCLTGYNYFDVLVSKCGVRPADVLGVVPGIINPDLIDAPVVCIGE